MPNSLNCPFDCAGPAIDTWECPGEFAIRFLATKLSRSDREFSEPDVWRDYGWEIACPTPDCEVSIVVLEPPTKGDWALKIAAKRRPFLLGQLLGRKASADAQQIHSLATDIHDALTADSRFANLRWAWDDIPDGSLPPGPPPIAG